MHKTDKNQEYERRMLCHTFSPDKMGQRAKVIEHGT